MSPHISVILTSYNHARFLAEAIDSVLAQTYANFTLIIADDGSTDSSWSIATQYRDSRIRFFRNEHNQGGLLNQVLHSGLVTGPLVAIHHSDDSWDPAKLDKQVSVLQANHHIAACFTNAHIIDSNSNTVTSNPHNDLTLAFYLTVFNQHNRPHYEWLRRFAYEGNCLCHPSVLIRKSCYERLGGYDQRFFQLPDFHFWIRLCLEHDIYVLPEKLTRMRVHDDGSNTSSHSVSNLIRKAFEHRHVLEPLKSIQCLALLKQAFPECRAHHLDSHTPVPHYILARALLASRRTPAQAFALDTLHDLLGNDETRKMLWESHNFSCADFSQLLSTVDACSIKRIHSNKQTIASLRDARHCAENRLIIAGHRNRLLERELTCLQATPVVRILRSLGSFLSMIVHTVQGKTPLDLQIRELKSSGLFDESYYLLRYRDVALAGVCPIRHYLLYGAREGRNPSAVFDTKQYCRDYQNVATRPLQINPLLHHIRSRRSPRRISQCNTPVT
jgi:glycosyltransferase involved in cell wall biosynthesis